MDKRIRLRVLGDKELATVLVEVEAEKAVEAAEEAVVKAKEAVHFPVNLSLVHYVSRYND